MDSSYIRRPVRWKHCTSDNGGRYTALIDNVPGSELGSLYDSYDEIVACINLAPHAMDLLRAVADVYEIGAANGAAIDALLATWDAAVGTHLERDAGK